MKMCGVCFKEERMKGRSKCKECFKEDKKKYNRKKVLESRKKSFDKRKAFRCPICFGKTKKLNWRSIRSTGGDIKNECMDEACEKFGKFMIFSPVGRHLGLNEECSQWAIDITRGNLLLTYNYETQKQKRFIDFVLDYGEELLGYDKSELIKKQHLKEFINEHGTN